MRTGWLWLSLLVGPALAGQPTKRPTDDERGRELYGRHCAACHGPANRGDGPATAALVFPVPDLVGKVKADKERITLVQQGRGPMPGFQATFDEADTKRVLGHMARLDGTVPEAPEPAGAEGPPAGEAGGEGPADDVGEGPG